MNGPHMQDLVVDSNSTRASLKKRVVQLVDGLWHDSQPPPQATVSHHVSGPGCDTEDDALGKDQQQELIKAAAFFADELEEGRFDRKRETNGRIILLISCGRHKLGKDGSGDKKEPESPPNIGARNRHLVMCIVCEELDVMNKLTRLLNVNALSPKAKADIDKGIISKTSSPDHVDDLPLNVLWISAADVLLHIFRNKAILPQEMCDDPKFVSNSAFLEAGMRFIDGKHGMMSAVCMSHCVGQIFEYCLEKTLGVRFLFVGGVSLCAEYLHKDNGVKRFIHWWRSKKVHPWEEEALYRRWWIYYSRDCGINQDMFGLPRSIENTKSLLVHWGRAISTNCARCLSLVAAKGPESGRTGMMKNKTLIKGMMFWFRSPLMVYGDAEMVLWCTRLIANLCVNETISLYFIREHSIISLLEGFVFCPHYKNLIEYLDVVSKLTSHQGVCRDSIAQNRTIVKALLSYCGSYEKEVAIPACKAITHLLTGSDTAKIVLECGFNIRQLIIWNDYNFYHELCSEWGNMKTAIKASGVREWHSQEARLKTHKAMATNTFDEDDASTRKEQGNKAFKRQDYKKAITIYTDALKLSPPSKHNIPCICLHYENVGNCRGHTCDCTYELWTPLPAQLYSNRAQCYLHLGKPKEAVENCDEAVARCLEGTGEAKELLLKSIYRRAKACFELGDMPRALMDAAYLNLQEKRDKQDPESAKLFDDVFFAYREKHGWHFMRRCFVCLKGEGEKLKRCANCEELYCSKECQMNDWQRRHKDTCSGNKKKKVAAVETEPTTTTTTSTTIPSPCMITEDLD